MTPDQLQRATGCTGAIAAALADPLSAAMAFYSIDTPKRIAAFLAQVGHESGSFRFSRELWGPTPAQQRYEGREDLGNVQPGDGKRYMGRGYIQTTGRYNYAKTRDRLRERFDGVPDFEEQPEALEEPTWACLSACDYWDSRKLNALADADQFEQITRKVNGGLNGYDDRLKRWDRAKAEFVTKTLEATASIVTHITKENVMPLPAILAAVLPTVIENIPRLGKLFGSGSEVAERNVKTAETVLEIVKEATGAVNAQDAVEKMAADPALVAVAQKAIEDNWFTLTEAGGGGIDGARKADVERMGATDKVRDIFKSHSFVVAVLVLPLVYLITLSIIGVAGDVQWSLDVRAAIAGSIVGSILGGLIGYYFGQTTTRNRTPSSE